MYGIRVLDDVREVSYVRNGENGRKLIVIRYWFKFFNLSLINDRLDYRSLNEFGVILLVVL